MKKEVIKIVIKVLIYALGLIGSYFGITALTSCSSNRAVECSGMGADGKFRIDGSALKLGYKCSTAAASRYIWGLTSKAEKAVLLAGQAYYLS